jgi:hypothetical protein
MHIDIPDLRRITTQHSQPSELKMSARPVLNPWIHHVSYWNVLSMCQFVRNPSKPWVLEGAYNNDE